ncbi:hypothetical protein EVAR_92638_1 [Eumeta japonica]|uniref:Uncharacterized protein n=1 Tax=Eumeta variegata TaxID=151549 RepID=A0A4C1SXP2_EUMVA|nr:hypothetical protein EVAR_92638_1 [Eumeta japonica]
MNYIHYFVWAGGGGRGTRVRFKTENLCPCAASGARLSYYVFRVGAPTAEEPFVPQTSTEGTAGMETKQCQERDTARGVLSGERGHT